MAIYTRFNNQCEIIKHFTTPTEGVKIRIIYEDGEVQERDVLISDLYATDGIREIMKTIKEL